MDPALARRTVFVAYSHEQAEWLERLRTHLRPLERSCHIRVWDDTTVRPGEKWLAEIQRGIAAARVAVLLISAEFLASDFVSVIELPALLARAEAGGAVILPVIVGHCLFGAIPALAQFQAVNPPSRPLVALTRAEQDAVFVNLAKRIQECVNKDETDPIAVYTSQLIDDLDAWRGLGLLRSIPFQNLYVPRQVYAPLQRTAISDSRFLEQMLQPDRVERSILCTGAPGSGKTFLLRNWARTLASDQAGPRARLPIYLPLGEVETLCRQHGWNLPLAELTAAFFQGSPETESARLASAVASHISEGSAVILLDGADEVSKNSRDKLRLWMELVRRSARSCCLVVASRPADFVEGLSAYAIYRLRPLDGPDQLQFFEHWFGGSSQPALAGRLSAAVLDSARLREPELAGNPLFLTMMCIEYERTESLSASPAALMERFSRILLEEWDVGQGRTALLVDLNLKLFLLESVAAHFFELGFTQFPGRNLLEFCDALLVATARQSSAAEAIGEIEERSRLLNTDRFGYVRFCHSLFQEFFTARHKVDVLGEREQLEWQTRHFGDPRFERVLQFYQELTAMRYTNAPEHRSDSGLA